jgi:hypothetical protein
LPASGPGLRRPASVFAPHRGGRTRASHSIHLEEGGLMLITILVILAIIALALFIWRNMAGRRV